jgi:diaminohydroxyphosphoribosylaminopyrimidine deaminase/5-amino-6-(5-phosphoribosylamino)uracil reductase
VATEKKLIEAGINVTVGVLERMPRTEQTIFTFHQKKRPYLILKWAESQDGFISPKVKSEQNQFISPMRIRDN